MDLILELKCQIVQRYIFIYGCFIHSLSYQTFKGIPKGIFPSGNFPNVKFPKQKLAKSVLSTALGPPYALTAALCPLCHPSHSARLTVSFEPPRSAHYPFLAAALGPLARS